MSASMYWRPVNPNPNVDDAMRHILARKIWDQDGSLSTEPYELGVNEIYYIQGLRDGGVAGAQELLDAIRKHGSIEVWIAR